VIIPCNFNILSWLKIVVEEEIHVDVLGRLEGGLKREVQYVVLLENKRRGGGNCD